MKALWCVIGLIGVVLTVGAAEVPMRRVVLYTSGVGFFEHAGKVKDDGRVTLFFGADQMSDLLKSLVVRDLDGGAVGAIRYPAQNSPNQILEAFPVNPAGGFSRKALLDSLRGARVRFANNLEGVIVGVEVRQAPQQLPVERVNFLRDDGAIVSADLDSLGAFTPTDPELVKVLRMALAMSPADRNANRKQVNIDFQGKGERRVQFGYVLETPVWKTSYRLVLDSAEKAFLQGWAIVENQSDADWVNLEVSLISGDPISQFRDLYQSQYRRIRQQPEPERAKMRGGRASNVVLQQAPQAARAPMPEMKAAAAFEAAAYDTAAGGAMEIVAAALGELFEYKISRPVTLPRREAAMLELLADKVKAEKLLTFNREDGKANPWNAVRMTNDTDKLLLAGPVTVFEGGAYGGDADLPTMIAGGTATVRYGTALDVKAEVRDRSHEAVIQSIRGGKGILQISRQLRSEVEYEFKNQGKSARPLLLLVRELPGWELDPAQKPWKTEGGFHLFRLQLEPEKPLKFPVVTTHVEMEALRLLPSDWKVLNGIFTTAKLTPAQKTAWEKAAALYAEQARVSRQIAEVDARLKELGENQERTRRNMSQLNRNEDFYRQLITRLATENQSIDMGQQERAELRKSLESAEKALAEYLLVMEL